MQLARPFFFDKPEYPAIFAMGSHWIALDGLRSQGVHPFPNSSSRRRLFNSLSTLTHTLESAGLMGQFWLFGSFVTTQPEPHDIDLIVAVPPRCVANPTD